MIKAVFKEMKSSGFRKKCISNKNAVMGGAQGKCDVSSMKSHVFQQTNCDNAPLKLILTVQNYSIVTRLIVGRNHRNTFHSLAS